jgi:hypothetical protein
MKASRDCRSLLQDSLLTQDGLKEHVAKEHFVEPILPPTKSDRNNNASRETSEHASGITDTSKKLPSPEKESTKNGEGGEKSETPKPVDPLRWFGAFATQPLKQAQILAIRNVEETIPKLININARMTNIEIDIRRAKKHRQKLQSRLEKMVENR